MAEYSKQKYYWIKLTDHFLTSDTVDFLLSQKDGANYVVLYQMLCLKSVNTDGLLARKIGEIIIPFDVEKIARDCKHFSIDTVRIALELYKSLGLVYEQENGILQIANFDRLIGSQTEGARRKELQRSNRGQISGQGVENCPPEIKILDIRDKDIKIINNKENITKEKIKNIVNYLNNKAKKEFRVTTPKTIGFIKARLNEGFDEKDFYTVIDKKCNDWLGTDYDIYLRPETLFGTKFEGYLNEKTSINKQTKKQDGIDLFREMYGDML